MKLSPANLGNTTNSKPPKTNNAEASTSSGTLKKAIKSAETDAPEEAATDEESVVETQAGQKAPGDSQQDPVTRAETRFGEVTKLNNATDKAVEAATLPKNKITAADVLSKVDGWDSLGDKPPTTTEIASTNPQTTNQPLTGLSQFGDIPDSNRPNIARDGVSPSVLASSGDAINQRFNYPSAQDFTAQQSNQPTPGFSPFGQGGGGQQGNGGGPTAIAIAQSGSSSGSGQVNQVSIESTQQSFEVADTTQGADTAPSGPDVRDVDGSQSIDWQ